MLPHGAPSILALAISTGCSVYDKTLLSPGASGDDTLADSSAGAAGGSTGKGGASAKADGSLDSKPDVSLLADSSAGGAAGAGGATGTGGEAGCTPITTDRATLNQGPILATFESGTHEEQEVTPYMYWYAYDDGTGETGALAGPFFASPREPVEDGNRYAGHFTGALHTGYGGGIGVSGALPLDASAYTGISFWAKGTGGVRLLVTTTSTDGNYCKCDGSDCGDGYLKEVVLTADFTQFTVKFAELKQMHHTVPFDPTGITGFNFAATLRSWDYWIDDLAFAP